MSNEEIIPKDIIELRGFFIYHHCRVLNLAKEIKQIKDQQTALPTNAGRPPFSILVVECTSIDGGVVRVLFTEGHQIDQATKKLLKTLESNLSKALCMADTLYNLIEKTVELAMMQMLKSLITEAVEGQVEDINAWLKEYDRHENDAVNGLLMFRDTKELIDAEFKELLA